ncbi:MAG: acetyl-CoA hydrolase/transferase family protein [Alphaproteobacteria bacterium]|nr:acetyl-CoA hydrolase/transferase family protein [Alphaproteobacteria bacterium]
MPDPDSLYAAKRVTAEDAAASIANDSNLILGMAVAMPPAFMAALAERALQRDGLTDLDIYYMHASDAAAETILRPELMGVLHPHPLFMSRHDRELDAAGRAQGKTWVHFVPCMFHQAGRLLTEGISPDCFVTTVSPMDRSGHFSLGTNADYGATLARSASRMIVEVNPNMPRTFGESLLHVRNVDMIVEHEAPLMEFGPAKPNTADVEIAARVAAEIPDRATIQMGVGGVPEAVMSQLRDHSDLGLHSELLSPPMTDLVRAGVITGAAKTLMPHKHVFTLSLGNREMYDFIDDNPSFVGYPAAWVNNPAVIRKNRDLVSVNGAIQIDLTGQINSESVGGHQFSGTGGQLDFVRGAYNAPGGKSLIALRSTAKDGTISRVVPQLNNAAVTDPRMDTHIVVTEFGSVDLKGMSLDARAKALIGLAHPDFRDELAAAERRMGIA